MTTRTFKQQGQGYGAAPASIVATIDGTQVFSGTVPTVDQPFPTNYSPAEVYGQDIFFWENTVDFAGTQTMSITVQNADLLLADTAADYCSNVSAEFDAFYSYSVDGVTLYDPLSNIVIGGTSYSRQSSPTGQWYWRIPAGSTFSATVNIRAGNESNVSPGP